MRVRVCVAAVLSTEGRGGVSASLLKKGNGCPASVSMYKVFPALTQILIRRMRCAQSSLVVCLVVWLSGCLVVWLSGCLVARLTVCMARRYPPDYGFVKDGEDEMQFEEYRKALKKNFINWVRILPDAAMGVFRAMYSDKVCARACVRVPSCPLLHTSARLVV